MGVIRVLRSWIETRIWAMPADSIVKIKIHDTVSSQAMEVLSAPALRALTPATMNIEAVFTEVRRSQAFQRSKSSSTRKAEP